MYRVIYNRVRGAPETAEEVKQYLE